VILFFFKWCYWDLYPQYIVCRKK